MPERDFPSKIYLRAVGGERLNKSTPTIVELPVVEAQRLIEEHLP